MIDCSIIQIFSWDDNLQGNWQSCDKMKMSEHQMGKLQSDVIRNDLWFPNLIIRINDPLSRGENLISHSISAYEVISECFYYSFLITTLRVHNRYVKGLTKGQLRMFSQRVTLLWCFQVTICAPQLVFHKHSPQSLNYPQNYPMVRG